VTLESCASAPADPDGRNAPRGSGYQRMLKRILAEALADLTSGPALDGEDLNRSFQSGVHARADEEGRPHSLC